MVNISKVVKRDGTMERFSRTKIKQSIHKALMHAHRKDHHTADMLTSQVTSILQKRYKKGLVEVETIRHTVEYVLVKNKFSKTAKAYILYRYS